jgi:hypothetical protein
MRVLKRGRYRLIAGASRNRNRRKRGAPPLSIYFGGRAYNPLGRPAGYHDRRDYVGTAGLSGLLPCGGWWVLAAFRGRRRDCPNVVLSDLVPAQRYRRAVALAESVIEEWAYYAEDWAEPEGLREARAELQELENA